MNRKYIYLLIVLPILCLAFMDLISYEVTSVYDGDTILLNDGQKVRYIGIDAPEIDHEGKGSEFMAASSYEIQP